jgi:hypothetical protein
MTTDAGIGAVARVNTVSDDIMVVYCDGPPDNDGAPTHERHPVKRYVRKLDTTGGFFWSVIAGADDPRPKPSQKRKLRFRCRVCGFDAKYGNNSINENGGREFTTRISEIFEALHATDTHEINVRVLVKWLLPVWC